MGWFDNLSERSVRSVARRSARRSFLSRFGFALVGATTIPALPVARAASARMQRQTNRASWATLATRKAAIIGAIVVLMDSYARAVAVRRTVVRPARSPHRSLGLEPAEIQKMARTMLFPITIVVAKAAVVGAFVTQM